MKTKKLLAYSLSSPDIDAHFYENAPPAIFCFQCNTILDKSYVPSALKLYSGKLPDLGGTYDGQEMCSTRFKEFCEAEGLEVDFYEIDMGKPFYHFKPQNILKYDILRRKTRFIGHCASCGNFAEVIGSTPVFFTEIFEPIQTGIYRTDLEFGSGSHKGFGVIVGLETREKMIALKFRGCTLVPIYHEEVLH
jgi:hypothetical protein